MKIRIEPTEFIERRQYEKAVEIERCAGGVLIAFGSGMAPQVHQWGPNLECLQLLEQLRAQLLVPAMADIAVRQIIAYKQEEKSVRAVKRALGGDGGLKVAE